MVKLTPLHERLLILLISMHSLIVGGILFFVPDWAAQFGGFDPIRPTFFARQAGIFHLVLVCGYLIEHFRRRGVAFLVTAKSIALVFLVLTAVFESVPWAVPVSGIGDGVMALLVWVVHRQVASSSSSSSA